MAEGHCLRSNGEDVIFGASFRRADRQGMSRSFDDPWVFVRGISFRFSKGRCYAAFGATVRVSSALRTYRIGLPFPIPPPSPPSQVREGWTPRCFDNRKALICLSRSCSSWFLSHPAYISFPSTMKAGYRRIRCLKDL